MSPHDETSASPGTLSDAQRQSYSQWITDASAAYAAGFTPESGYATLVTGDWYVVTATNVAGCAVGSSGAANGGTGCPPGTAGSGDTTQEFLA